MATNSKAGKGILLVSSELPELIRCCDRIIVLNNGRLTAAVPGNTSQAAIMTAANPDVIASQLGMLRVDQKVERQRRAPFRSPDNKMRCEC